MVSANSPAQDGLQLIRGSSAVEQPAVNRLVVGSNPTRGAIFFNHLANTTEHAKRAGVPLGFQTCSIRRAQPCRCRGDGTVGFGASRHLIISCHLHTEGHCRDRVRTRWHVSRRLVATMSRQCRIAAPTQSPQCLVPATEAVRAKCGATSGTSANRRAEVQPWRNNTAVWTPSRPCPIEGS